MAQDPNHRKRDKSSGEFMALKRPDKKIAVKKFKGVRLERAAAKARTAKKTRAQNPLSQGRCRDRRRGLQ
jgi:hypothetical protein